MATSDGQFMVVTHYAYQVIRIPSPTRAITVVGNVRTILCYDKRSLDMVELTHGSQPENTGSIGHPVKVYVIPSHDNRLMVDWGWSRPQI